MADAAADGAPAWPITVRLAYPVEFGKETIDSLEFRRGRLGDLKGMRLDEAPAVDGIVLLASRLCGKPIKVIEMLDPDDAAEVLPLVLGFFAKCLGAGKTP